MAERTELDVLNHLLETCRDGEHGFFFAAEHATDPKVKDLFAALGVERGRSAEELIPHVRRLGGQATSGGTTAGVIHRGWMSLKGAVTRHTDEVLLAEAERGERAAIHAYDQALHGFLPPTVSDIVERQHAAIREAHARIVDLDKARKPSV
jgi:uncharacterized protein (TIGR02284 family)